MCKVKFVSVFVLLVLLLGVVPGVAITGRDNDALKNSGCRTCAFAASISSEPITDWQRYEDPDFKLALEYPDGWKVETTIQQPRPFSDPFAIIKRQTFIGPEGLIDLDIWLANGRDLGKWLKWYKETRSELPISKPNATVAGRPAVMFVENGVTVDMLAAFFSDGEYIYRLWYTVSYDKRGLQAFRHMLDTFTSPSKEMTMAQVPQDLEKDAERAVEDSTILLGNQCCGNYSSYCSLYFSCCSDRGNCTWWVCYKYGAVPFRGDAGTWWNQVPNYYNWGRGGQPRRNPGENIAWWSGSPGHVAHVANYTGGSTVSITEMFWCASCFNARTISVTTPSGYIYEKYPIQP
jgi:hypothetical protein